MATYIRLTDYKDSDSKEEGFFKPENRYEAKQEDFPKIPGSPIAYWVSNRVKEIFDNTKIKELANAKMGLTTCNNELFVRYWSEVDFIKTNFKWFYYNKAGGMRKWYGNNDYLVNWENDGLEIHKYSNVPLSFNGAPVRAKQYYFRECASWGLVSSADFNARYYPHGYIFDVGANAVFAEDVTYYLAFFNTYIANNLLKILNPTLNYSCGVIAELPIIFPKQESTKQTIETLTQQNIDISKEEWDSRETSWDFTKNELLKHKSDSKIETAYNNFCKYWSEKFYKLHANEEELNRLFIDIYELQDELTPDVELKDITILKSETKIVDDKLVFQADEIMKQFISYAVGVMFGRYSLDSNGLVVANLNQDYPKDTTFEIDDDNVIPVLEDDYFSDDIASRVVNFVKTTFGAENLNENINFIEKCLGKTIRVYMVKDFYEDHLKRYKKRPIYWMVSSPKKAFMSLSYMHRYQSDIFARVQNNYLREYTLKLEGTKDILKQIILDESSSNKDKKDADKKIKDIENKLKELISFDRDVLTSFAQNRVDIDLDDGVKVNYNKFKDVLYVIKGLDKE
ncbi:hypothetical protein CRU94_04020 [Arcobacter sp. AHV-9/2010]|uniref:BREX-1 system adenine-specific DNA-methyltransferase PglX n=1 Tax=Arcobacter sp. AHV-9/2010 TaxID=2021861 RepID=UPI00100ABB1B|nr:BREX-1 system adenine-specific DNA-methyltransferase PglX [Arcobacter sp. CECT 9299]RXJ95789.1 hypothetical protein CRU94_04020 [Arcobacter sp. CECT 9299]